MIWGEYPCCDAPLELGVPERTPVYFKEACPACGAIVWHKVSRLDPTSWVEEEFLRLHRINHETLQVEEISWQERAAENGATPEQITAAEAVREAAVDAIVEGTLKSFRSSLAEMVVPAKRAYIDRAGTPRQFTDYPPEFDLLGHLTANLPALRHDGERPNRKERRRRDAQGRARR